MMTFTSRAIKIAAVVAVAFSAAASDLGTSMSMSMNMSLTDNLESFNPSASMSTSMSTNTSTSFGLQAVQGVAGFKLNKSPLPRSDRNSNTKLKAFGRLRAALFGDVYNLATAAGVIALLAFIAGLIAFFVLAERHIK